MRPRIREITLTRGGELEDFCPSDNVNFHTAVRAIVGIDGEQDGEEAFDFSVCTPAWLASEAERRGYYFVRRQLLVPHWDPDIIRKAIKDFVAPLSGDSWGDIAGELGKVSTWEFENYEA
jgi:hypothetical protein